MHLPKRQISKAHYTAIKNELIYWQQNEMLDSEQAAGILDLYQIKQGISFLRVILVTGAVLVGLGILSFIASNWYLMSKLSKFLLIILIFAGSNCVSYLLRDKFPKTSVSLLYLGTLIYGAGIFLVGQMFNYGGYFSYAFLLWGAGILPIAYFFRDKLIFIFSNILFLIYVEGMMGPARITYWPLLTVPVVFFINYRLESFAAGAFFNNLVLLNAVGYYLGKWNTAGLYIAAVYMLIGFIMLYSPIKVNTGTYRFTGLLTIGIAGLFLTDKSLWDNFFGSGITASIIFSVAFLLYLFYLLKKGMLVPIIFVCGVILKFYFDTFYDFMSKSVFFIIGGLILIMFGFYFERLRNRKGADPDEE
jgi:uncharacterized membrane protein